MYIRYLRRKDGTPYATIVGLPTEDGGTFGLSRCNKQDTFTKKTGRAIATARAYKQARLVDEKTVALPPAFDQSLLEAMRTRLQSSLRGPVFIRAKERDLLATAISSIMQQRERVETTNSVLTE